VRSSASGSSSCILLMSALVLLNSTHAIRSQPPLAWKVSGGVIRLMRLRIAARARLLPSTLESITFTPGYCLWKSASSASIACASPPCFHQCRISTELVSGLLEQAPPPSVAAKAKRTRTPTPTRPAHPTRNLLHLDLIDWFPTGAADNTIRLPCA